MSDLEPELERQLSDDFDRVGGPQIGDAALIARLAAAASAATAKAGKVAPVRPLPRRKLPTRALLLAAVVALLASAAAAHVWLGKPSQAPVPTATQPAASPHLPPAAVEPPSALAPPVEASPTAAASVAPAELARTETAEALFAKANAARRAGQSQRAAALYQQLQRSFPGAAEVQLSRVSLGRILLDQRAAGGALGQFDHYLAAPGGLRAEALYGRARALGMLGRSSEERSAWEQLLRDYPTSVYAASATTRLSELR